MCVCKVLMMKQDGHESNHHDRDHHGVSFAYSCGYLQQVQIMSVQYFWYRI
jgi:hypothetical protein